VLEKNAKNQDIVVKSHKQLQRKEKQLVTGDNLKREEDKGVVHLAYSVKRTRQKEMFVKDYSENVNGLEKHFGGHQNKFVNG